MDKFKIAHQLANKLEELLGDDYGLLIDGLNLNSMETKWAKGHIRWTLIDEETGENLLEKPNDKNHCCGKYIKTKQDRDNHNSVHHKAVAI